jgi:hypothetical protein
LPFRKGQQQPLKRFGVLGSRRGGRQLAGRPGERLTAPVLDIAGLLRPSLAGWAGRAIRYPGPKAGTAGSMSTENASEPDPHRWRALGICLIGGFMVLLDVSIVNVALPSIKSGLGRARASCSGCYPAMR